MQTTSTAQQGAFSPSSSSNVDGVRTTAASKLRTAKALFVLAAGVSFLFSVYLWFMVDREQGLFVGLWVPSILALGALLLSGKGDQR